MIKSDMTNPLDGFVCHGIKTVSSYNYYLFIDNNGHAVIMRAAIDNSEFRFCELAKEISDENFTDVATQIDSFWLNPDTHTYKYMFLV